MLYWYNWFSWWWARRCSKHTEKWNAHIEKELRVKLVIYKNYRRKIFGVYFGELCILSCDKTEGWTALFPSYKMVWWFSLSVVMIIYYTFWTLSIKKCPEWNTELFLGTGSLSVTSDEHLHYVTKPTHYLPPHISPWDRNKCSVRNVFCWDI
jgi:hypothetical protein